MLDLGHLRLSDRVLGVGVEPDETLAVVAQRAEPRRSPELIRFRPAIETTPLETVPEGYGLLVQPLPEGLLIIERRRLRSRRNATVYASDGSVSHTFEVGDGVQHVLADRSGQLWVSYFDEGTSGGDPLSGTGLNRFDVASGALTWAFPGRARRLPRIFDCYALNVADTGTWAYYLDVGFTLVRVGDDGTVEAWDSPISGATGLAVLGDELALVGSYDDPASIAIVHAGPGRLEPRRSLAIPAPSTWHRSVDDMVGRGSRVYALTRSICSVLSLDPLRGSS